ncbi:hypothetical protein MEG_00881 [Bartonella tamiae Th307]|uniref:Aminotransferase class I/classII large domain-containing protein n=1 Tax=Bartonella tamiae Th239 TaxID=1094558 RepID=J0R4K8_9HYPH|nr:hypothetical protein ME5_01000 [Bartonella tamiae Th239]EJF94023.1 hypothetical protein MEG_00881 [Bartonella tamiae Th307]
MITNGVAIDALLGLTLRQYMNLGDVAVNSLGGYPTFDYHVHGYGGKIVFVAYKIGYVDLDGLAHAAYKHYAKIVYLANPDNPLGTWHDKNAIVKFIEKLCPETLCILDEADGGFVSIDTKLSEQTTWPNVLRMRTFSKAYGLAGLRCGYAFADKKLINPIHKICDHFSVNRLAHAAVKQALLDQIYLKEILI